MKFFACEQLNSVALVATWFFTDRFLQGQVGVHMGAVEISAWGAKKIFQGGGLQKKTQGGGLFSKLKVWVERGIKEKFSCATFLSKNSSKNENYFKTWCFSYICYGSGRGQPWKMSFFLYWGGQFLPQGGGLGFEGSASLWASPPSPPPCPCVCVGGGDNQCANMCQ